MIDDQLTKQERRIKTAARTGELVDLSVGDEERDDPAYGAAWDGARAVHAELLIDLLTTENIPGRQRGIKVQGARIMGPLDLESMSLIRPLWLRNCYFDLPINLDEATAPAIRLPGCYVPGITANYVQISTNLELNDGFTAKGRVSLIGAHIGGALNFDQAILADPDKRVLVATRITVEGTFFCRDGFTAQGEIDLLGAHIRGALLFVQATLNNPGGCALFGPSLAVDRDMYCNHDTIASGAVNLYAAKIGKRLDFRGAHFENPGGLALDLERLTAGALQLLPRDRPDGAVDLINAHVGNFYDDPATWPTTIRLRGFSYEHLENHSVSVRERLQWLARDPHGYIPQAYEQLAAVYTRDGYDDAARQVRIAKQRRRCRQLKYPGKLWNWLLYVTVGYGYRTWLAAVWLGALTALGTQVFTRANAHHMMQASTNAPAFHPIAYTLDVLLPIVDFGQERAWTPHGWAAYWTWALIAIGWVLTTAVVAGLTGVFKRD